MKSQEKFFQFFKKSLAAAIYIAICGISQAAVLNFEGGYGNQESNPLDSTQKWFGPSVNSGNTIRNNKVNINADFSEGMVFGGWTHKSLNVTDNELTIRDNIRVDSAIGGFNSNASAMYNVVTLEGQANNVLGGYTTGRGLARSNSVAIAEGATVKNVLGGYAVNAQADSNDVTVDGTVTGKVYGGFGKSGAESNYVAVSGTVKGAVYAGYAVDGNALYNGISIEGNAKDADIYGGYTKNGNVQSNFITVKDTASVENITGGFTQSGDASYNTVDVLGKAQSVVGGQSDAGRALNNSVTILSGLVDSVKAGSGTTQAFGNQLRIKKDAVVNGAAYAGYAKNGSASYNYMEANGKVNTIAGGCSENGKADFNYVNVLDGAEVHDIYGGKGGMSASHNTLLVKNAKVLGTVYGGQGKEADANIVILSGRMDLHDVYGGHDGTNPLNAHNVISAEGSVSVNKIDGFKVLKLTVNPENIKVSDSHEGVGDNRFILSSKEDVDLTNKTLVVSSHKVDPKEKIALLWSDGEIHTNENTVVEGDNTFVFKRWTSKVNHEYEHELGIENIVNNDDFVEETVVSDEAKTLSKASLSSTALIKEGADFILEDAKNAARFSLKNDNNFAIYAAAHGGYTNYDHKSEFSLRDYHVAIGGAFKQENLLWSVFAETGIGEASLKENADIDTDLSYVGLGTLIDYEFANGLYVDTVLRFGYIKTDFDGTYEEDKASFVSRNFYGSVQAGGGYRFSLNDQVKADVYARYLGLYETTDNFNLHDKNNSHMSVDPRVAHAFRAGTQFDFKLNPFVSMNAGIGIEHIFDSPVKTFVNGYALNKENIDGTSFIGSLGVAVTSSVYHDFSFGANVHFTAGDREGAAFSFIAEYEL